jgi:alcohol dehydrogenase class IV
VEFSFATAGRIRVGPGVRQEAAAAASQLGARALVVTGQRSERAGWLLDQLDSAGLHPTTFAVAVEPTLDTVRAGARAAREAECDFVVACGGGAAIDAGKAIAALMSNGGDPLDYVEVVGRGLPLERAAAPLVAVPTTAGTGSEVTKNSVLGVPEERVKVSMRSDDMLPTLALVDPELTHSLPAAVTASTGLDALTHLIEAYVSKNANPLTDALCREGIGRAGPSLARAFRDGDDLSARAEMTLVSLFGGLALANAKLGAVHGFAGPAGGMWDAPHGCLCGRFLPFVLAMNVRALQRRAPDSPSLPRFAEVASWLTGNTEASAGDGVDWIESLCAELAVPSLANYGVAESDVEDLVERAQRSSSMQGNPIVLEHDELCRLVRQAM